MKQFFLLDCTLRDGGYYNNWDFDLDLVEEYLNVMSKINVDYVEIGLRSLKNNGFKGPYAYSKEAFLNSINIPSDLKIGVMINASELIVENQFCLDTLKTLVPVSIKNSKVTLVRIAAHGHEISKIGEAIGYLKNLGYTVGLNLMQIAQLEKDQILQALEYVELSKPDVFYIADSLGGLKSENLHELFSLIKSVWSGPYGFHAHDNLRLALSNTVTSLQLGAKWVDATVMGMGRGPGNTKTEDLLSLSDKCDDYTSLAPLFDFIDNYFNSLHKKYNWGTNPFYILSALKDIHPTYIQTLLSDRGYSKKQILEVILALEKQKSNSYDPKVLQSLKGHDSEQKFYPEFNPEDYFSDKKVLLLAPGQSLSKHKLALLDFIKKESPVVVEFNCHEIISSENIDFRIAIHPLRIMADIEAYKQSEIPLITSLGNLPENVVNSLSGCKIYNKSISVSKDGISFNIESLSIPNLYVISYALLLMYIGKADEIFLAGFDGYPHDKLKQSIINNVFTSFRSSFPNLKITAITPTTYQIPSKSIYGLN